MAISIHPGLEDDEILPLLAASWEDRTKSERILNVMNKDVADQIRNFMNATTSPVGITKKEPKVAESELPSAHKKSEPALKYHPEVKTFVPGPTLKTHPEVKTFGPIAKIPFTEPAPVAKIAVPAPTPASKIAVDKSTPDIVVTTADKPVSKITMEPNMYDVVGAGVHPGLTGSEVINIIEEGGPGAERVMSVITTGKAPAAVKTLSNQALLLIGAVILILFVVK